MKKNGKYSNLFWKHLILLDECFEDCLSILKDNLDVNQMLDCNELYESDEIPEIKVYVHENGYKRTVVVNSLYFNKLNEIVLEHENGFVKFYRDANVVSDDIFSLYDFLVSFYRVELV